MPTPSATTWPARFYEWESWTRRQPPPRPVIFFEVDGDQVGLGPEDFDVPGNEAYMERVRAWQRGGMVGEMPFPEDIDTERALDAAAAESSGRQEHGAPQALPPVTPLYYDASHSGGRGLVEAPHAPSPDYYRIVIHPDEDTRGETAPILHAGPGILQLRGADLVDEINQLQGEQDERIGRERGFRSEIPDLSHPKMASLWDPGAAPMGREPRAPRGPAGPMPLAEYLRQMTSQEPEYDPSVQEGARELFSKGANEWGRPPTRPFLPDVLSDAAPIEIDVLDEQGRIYDRLHEWLQSGEAPDLSGEG